MLRVDPTLNHIPARREHVVSLFESINQPLVNIPNHGTAPTGAFLLGTRNEHGYYTVFVYLHQPETRAVIIYVSEPRNLTAEQFRVEESEAVRFVESMGFMVDSVHFRQLGQPEQDAVMARVPIFRPPVATMDLYEVHEEQIAGQADLIFGSMGGAGDELFRRAGLSQPPANPMGGHGTGPMSANVRFGGPGSGPIPTMQPSMQSMQPMQPMQPMQAQPFGTQTPSQPGFGMQYPPAGLPQGGLQQPPPQPMQPAQPQAQSAEALERLGRLLAAFGVLLALALPIASIASCKTVSTPEPDGENSEDADSGSPFQNQIDLGEQNLAQRRWPDAISAFAEVLKEDPNEKTALRGTGLAYMSLGRKDQAEQYYRQVINVDPKWSEPKNELASLLISDGRCAEAETLLRTVTQDIFYGTPEFAEHNLALALSCQGRVSEAVGKLATLVSKHPQFCLGYLTLSQLSAQAKQQPETTVKACEDFNHYCVQNQKIRQQITPDHQAVCYLRSGMAHAEMGDVESARASFMRCQGITSGYAKECQQALEMLPE